MSPSLLKRQLRQMRARLGTVGPLGPKGSGGASLFASPAAITTIVKGGSVKKGLAQVHSSCVAVGRARLTKDSSAAVAAGKTKMVNATASHQLDVREITSVAGVEAIECQPGRSLDLERRKVRGIESALAEIYIQTFRGVQPMLLKHRSARTPGSKPIKVDRPTSENVKRTTLFDCKQNFDAATFVPSPALISYWLDGLNSVRSEAGKPQLYVESRADFEFYCSELIRSLDTVIGNFAKLKAYDGGRYHMTFGGRILSTIETLIVDELLIPPSFTSCFVRELHGLLVSQSRLRPRFSGRWGALVVDDRGELIFDLVRRKRRTLAQVTRAQ